MKQLRVILTRSCFAVNMHNNLDCHSFGVKYPRLGGTPLKQQNLPQNHQIRAQMRV